MTEGRTSAAEANVDAEDRPTDAPASSTESAGAGDATDSAGTNGHDTTTNGTTAGDDTTSSNAEKSETAEESETAETAGKADDAGTVPAADLPGDDSADAPAHGAAATGADAKAGTKVDDTKADDAPEGDEEWAEAEDKAYKKELRKGFAFGAAGGILIGAIVALLLGALVWPGYLMGPGSPDDSANQIVAALSAKNGPEIDNLSCKGPDGKPVSQLSGQVLQYITKVAPAGPATTLIDTEARAPVDVTLSVQGQTQTLPSELVLGEVKGDWCLKGLAQRQQQ
jgi:hypothetical protein